MFFKKKKKPVPVRELRAELETPDLEETIREALAQEAPEDGVEYDLDAILGEFHQEEPAPEEKPAIGETPALEEPAEEEAPIAEEAPVPEEEPAVTGDTLVVELPEQLEAVSDDTQAVDLELLSGDTVRLDADEVARAAGEGALEADTVPFEPITDAQLQAEKEKTEPFSEGWEPEYEQPIGEYIPPQPILFHPRSRLRELKRKLVSGPERRYYELSEKGFVRLQAAMFVTLLVAVLSAAASVLFELGIWEDRRRLVAFGQLFGMLVAALMGTNQLIDGVGDMFKKRFSLNSLLIFSFIACIADGVFCLRQERVPCCAAFTVQMFMSLWSAYHDRSIELGQMDTMRKATRLDSIVAVEEYHEGTMGLLRGEGQVEDFMEHYREPAREVRTVSRYALIALGVSLVLGLAGGLLQGSLSFGVQVLAVSLLAAVPGTFFISDSRPMAILEKRLHKVGTVLCGGARTEILARRAVFPLVHQDLFPTGSCMLNGVEYYGSRDPDQVVAYATAVITADGGGLAPLFDHLLTSRNGRRYGVENLRLYGGGGIGAEVEGEPVLVGVQSFLKDMGVEIPQGTMVDQAVYVAIDGDLCGVFAVTYTRTKSAANGLRTLCSYRSLQPLMGTGDFMLTEEFVRAKFGVNTRRLAFPTFAMRSQLAKRQPTRDDTVLAMATRDGLSGFAYAVTGARSLRTAARLGRIIHMLGGILGLLMVAVLAVLGAADLLTPVNMLLFQLIWMIPGLLVTEWTRSL